MMSFAEIGREIGVSEKRAIKIYAHAIAKLRRKPEQLRRVVELARALRDERNSIEVGNGGRY